MSKSLSDYAAKKETRRYLPDTAVSLKKGDFNTPPVILILKKENGGFDCYSKPPLGRLYSVRRVKILPPNNGFFISRWAVNISFLSGICFYSFKWNTHFFGYFFNWHSLIQISLTHVFHIFSDFYNMVVGVIKTYHSLSPCVFDYWVDILNRFYSLEFVDKGIKIIFLKI